MTRIPSDHSTAGTKAGPPTPSSVRLRTASVTSVIGWRFANHSSQSGMLFVSTNALLTKVSGNTTAKMMPCRASGVRTSEPAATPSQDRANPKSSITPTAAMLATMPPSGRNPTSRPTTHMIAIASVARSRSVIVRPVRTEDCVIGSERKRSIMPFWRSFASSTEV